MMRRVGLGLGVLLMLFVALYVVSQLRTSRIEVPRPSGGKGAADVHAAPSRLAVDLQVSLPALVKAINRVVPKTYSGVESDALGDAATDDTLKWNVSLGEITLEPAGDALKFRVPITAGHATVHGRFGVKKKNKGPLGWIEEAAGFTASQSADFAGTVNGTLHPRIMPDWTVLPGLTLSVDLSKAEAGLFGDLNIKLSFRDAIKNKLASKLNDQAAEINRRLASDGTLRSIVQKTWNDLHVATQVHSAPSVWVVLKPVSIGASQLSVAGDSLSFAMGVVAHTEVYVGSEKVAVATTPLPTLQNVSNAQGFSVSLPIAVSLSDFHGIRPAGLGVSDTIETSLGKVRVLKVYLVSDNERLYVGADLVADLGWMKKTEATVYLAGRPIFDPNANQLRVEGLAYDLSTKNALVGAADVALEPTVLGYLQSLAVFDASKAREDALAQADKELSKLLSSLPKGIDADLRLTDARVGGVRVAPGWLYLLLEASGRSGLKVYSLDDLLK
mgnify:CR=1 FL=1